MSDAQVLATTTRTARKQHGCWMCRRPIVVGTKYQDDRCACDGRAYTLRCHLDCFDAWCSWEPDSGGELLVDLADGHLPPCPWAWSTVNPDTPCSCGERLSMTLEEYAASTRPGLA